MTINKFVLSKLNIFNGFFITPHVSRIAAIILLTLIAGCAGPEKQVSKKRYFWPTLPDQPRIEGLAVYRNQHDLPKSSGQIFIESIAGQTPPINFKRPWGIVSDGAGKVYIADTGGGSVIVYDFNDNKVEHLGKGEYSGLFGRPVGVALDPSGNIYVSDSDKQKVFVFKKDGRPHASFGGPGVLDWPAGIAIDGKLNRIYVVNVHRHDISVFELGTWKELSSIGKRGEGEGEFNYPTDVAIDSKGNIVVADAMNARVQILDSNGKFIRKFGKRGDGISDFQQMKGIAINKDDIIFVTDGRSNKVLLFDEEGQALMVFGTTDRLGTSFGGLNGPSGISIDKDEKLYVMDSMGKKFYVFKIINDEWLKEHPIKEEEVAAPIGEKKKKKK